MRISQPSTKSAPSGLRLRTIATAVLIGALSQVRRRGAAAAVGAGETITPEAEEAMAANPNERALVRRYLARIPLGHAGTPRDQAMAVLFLASDDARFISAQTLVVDGGEIGGGGWYDDLDAPPLPSDDRPVTG